MSLWNFPIQLQFGTAMFDKLKQLILRQSSSRNDVESQSLLHEETPKYSPAITSFTNPEDEHVRKKYGNHFWVSENIPNDIWIQVFSYLKHPQDLCNASIVCKKWHLIVQEDKIWHGIYKKNFNPFTKLEHHLYPQFIKPSTWQEKFIFDWEMKYGDRLKKILRDRAFEEEIQEPWSFSRWLLWFFCFAVVCMCFFIVGFTAYGTWLEYWPRFINNFKWFDAGKDAVGFIALGQRATGFIAIGQLTVGVFTVGQASFGVVCVGQITIGLLFGVGQFVMGFGVSIGQLAISTLVYKAQLGIALWKTWKASRAGISILAPIVTPASSSLSVEGCVANDGSHSC